MAEEETQDKAERILKNLMGDGTPEGIGFCKRFIEHYDGKGFYIESYKKRQTYRERLLLNCNLNYALEKNFNIEDYKEIQNYKIYLIQKLDAN